jgi:putative transposase
MMKSCRSASAPKDGRLTAMIHVHESGQQSQLSKTNPLQIQAGKEALTAFEAGNGASAIPRSVRSGGRHRARSSRFFTIPKKVRKIIYTTNAIEMLNSKLRRAVRSRGHFPSDEAPTMLLYLILNRSENDWKIPAREWTTAPAQLAVNFGERFIKAMAA